MKTISFEQEIYTFDIDSSHHVSNITYIKWMEIARNKLASMVGMNPHEIEKLGFAPVIKKTEISYKKALYLGDKVRVELFFSELKKISGTTQINFYNQDDELVARGFQEVLFISLATKRPHRLSEQHRDVCAQYLNED